MLQLSSHEYNTFTSEIKGRRKKTDQAISQGDINVDTLRVLICLFSRLWGERIRDLHVLRGSFQQRRQSHGLQYVIYADSVEVISTSKDTD